MFVTQERENNGLEVGYHKTRSILTLEVGHCVDEREGKKEEVRKHLDRSTGWGCLSKRETGCC